MKQTSIFLLFALLSLFACQTDKNKTDKKDSSTVTVNENDQQQVSLSDYVDSFEYIELETTDDNLINHLTKVFFVDDKIVLADRLEQQILFFDAKGRYLYKIHKQGQGPDEYLSLETVLMDDEDRIIVHDFRGRKLNYYTMEGKYLKSITGFSDNALIRYMTNLPNGNFLCYVHDFVVEKVGERASGLWEVDSMGTFVHSYFAYETMYPILYNEDNSYFQTVSDGDIKILDIVNQKICRVDEEGVSDFISFDIKNDTRKDYAGESYTADDYIICASFQEKKDFLIADWFGIEGKFYSLFSKKDNSTVLTSAKNFWSRKSGLPLGRKLFIDSNRNDVLLTSFSGPDILDMLKEDYMSPQDKKKIEKITQGKTENEILDMNPVLLLLRLK
ncbi:hypothetical protein M2480_002379 [Parabacteroides sp. PFB2-12]|uniref:6-bladed beta-propeller n=1 Tax=unclassified Parabacteroides TaxID=2649774 RepID=UPI0024762754|nr:MULTISPECIES: 6-bladed beta-propeller [unclassified Parabacteroides]MDH6343635.1 hypothetical protein [Parabacteroides sp. PM6-13]MDH6391384.1 hypothetical protein [Parabacteroides sp. PFB2-12]